MRTWQGLFLNPNSTTQAGSTLWVESSVQVQVSRSGAAWTTTASLHPFGTPLSEVLCDLPPDVTLASATGDSLVSWNVTGEKTGAKLHLKFRQIAPRSVQIILTGFLAENQQAWQLTAPRWQAAGQATRFTVEDASEQPLALTELKQGTLVENRLLAAPRHDLKSPHRWGIRARDPEFQARFAPLQPANKFRVTQENALHLATDRLELFSRLSFFPLATAVPQQIDIELPADWIVTSITAADSSKRTLSWDLIAEKPSLHKIRLQWKDPLPDKTVPKVHLQAHRSLEHWPPEESPVSVPLPKLHIPDAYRQTGQLIITSTDPLQLLPRSLQGFAPLPYSAQKNLLAAYQFAESDAAGEVQVSRLPAQIAASGLVSARLEREHLQAAWESRVQIGGGGARQIRISLPEQCGDGVRFSIDGSSPRISHQSAAPPENGSRTWTVEFDRRVIGEIRLWTTLILPRGKETSFRVPLPNFPDAERQSGQVTVEGDAEQQLTVIGKDLTGQPLPEISPADLQTPTQYSPQHRIVAAYRILAGGSTVTLQEKRLPADILPVAYCRELRLKSILAPESPRLLQARWSLQAGRIAGWALHLPNGARLWSAQINNVPVEVRHSGRVENFIAAPENSVGITEQNLTVIYEDSILEDEPLGTEHQAVPLLQIVTANQEIRPLLVMEHHWEVHHPPTLILSPGNPPVEETYPRANGLSPWQWLQNWTFSYGQLYQLLFVLGAIAVLVLFVRLLQFLFGKTNFTLPGLVTGVLLFVVCGVIVSELIPRVQSARETSQRAARLSRERDAARGIATTIPQSEQLIEREGVEAMPAAPVPPKSPLEESVAGKPLAPAQQQAQPPAKTAPLTKNTTWGLSRLSVLAQLIPPSDFQVSEYHYRGASGLQPPILVVRFCQVDIMAPQLLILALGAALICWLTRKRPAAWRLCGALGLFLPLAAGVWLSREWHPLLVALMNGTLAGGLLVLLWHISRKFASQSQSQSTETPFAEASRSLTLLLIVGFCSLTNAAHAAEPNAPAAKPAPPVATPPSVPAPQPPILVPLDDLLHPEKTTRVWLPWQKYLELKGPEAASSSDQEKARPHVTELHLQGTLHPPAENAPLSATFKVRLLLVSPDKEPREIPLPFDQGELRAPQINGQPAKIVPPDAAHPTWRIIVESAGSSVIDAELHLSNLVGNPSKGELTLPIHSVPAGTCELAFPTADLRFSLRASQPLPWNKAPRTPQGTTLQFPLGRIDHPKILWSTVSSASTARLRARISSQVDLGDVPRVTQKLTFELDRDQATEIHLPLPGKIVPQSLSVTEISGWELTGSGDKRELVLTPTQQASRPHIQPGFPASLAPPDQSQPFQVPRLIPAGARNPRAGSDDQHPSRNSVSSRRTSGLETGGTLLSSATPETTSSSS
ncbi:MAG: hypothetical protein U0903_16370 [Planctomycetales bacterium]